MSDNAMLDLARRHGVLSPSVAPPAAPLLAIGMVIAPHNAAKRQLVRDTMLKAETVRSGETIFRFLIGCPSGQDCGVGHAPEADVLRLSAVDGAEVSHHGPHCACTEKTSEWLKYAVSKWPGATFYGKTEDDAYVHLDGLVAELHRLHAANLPHVLYGKMSTCAMPTAPRPPTAFQLPTRGDFRHLRNKLPFGYQGCFLGDLESMEPPFDAHEATAVWRARRGASAWCGDGLPAPFPVGALMVAQADLARRLVGCEYAATFLQRGFAANRATSCSVGAAGAAAGGSFASLTCDCVYGHLLSQCGGGTTIADMTWTRSHEYGYRAGGLAWVAPSSLSLVVHGLKRHEGRSGPNNTEAGEWHHTHAALHRVARRADAPPPLLWRYEPATIDARPAPPPASAAAASAAAAEAPSDAMLRPLQPEVHEWYVRACGNESAGPEAASLRARAERHTARVKGPRPRSLAPGAKGDVEYFGGNPLNWRTFGCHPSRFHAFPSWPPRPEGAAPEEPSLQHQVNGDSSLQWQWAEPAEEVERRAH